MLNPAARVTRKSLVITDPRRYDLNRSSNGVLAAIRKSGYWGDLGFHAALEAAITHIYNGENEDLDAALLAAGNADEHATVSAALTAAACRYARLDWDDELVQVIFGIPLTVHPIEPPFMGTQPAQTWLQPQLLERALVSQGLTRGAKACRLLPHPFALVDLEKLTWTDWQSLAMVLGSSSESTRHPILPTPCPFEPFSGSGAQARLLLGTFTGSPAVVNCFIESGTLNESHHVATLTRLLQNQLGTHCGLKVVAGVPALATAALSNGWHMNNCAQLYGLGRQVAQNIEDELSFQVTPRTDDNGEGSLLFETCSTSYAWRLSKSEPWPALQAHWRILLSHVPAPYVKLQLGLALG